MAEEKQELNLSRQSRLVPIDKLDQYTFDIFGVGSVGSHVVRTLAKTGAKKINVYDMDTVEEENIAAQAFGFKHIGMNKVDAMKDIIKEEIGLDIGAFHGMIDDKTEITPEPNKIYMCFFDSFEARKLVFDKLKDYPIIFVDARIGRYDFRHYLVDCTNAEQTENYGKSLDTTAVSELICGEKASAPINALISGKIVMNSIAFISGNSFIKVEIGNAMHPANSIIAMEERTPPVVEQPEPQEAEQSDAGSVETTEEVVEEQEVTENDNE